MANNLTSTPLQLDGTLQTAITVPALTKIMLFEVRVSNKDGLNTSYVNLTVVRGATTYYLCGKNTPVPAESSLPIFRADKAVFLAGDVIQIQASEDADLDAWFSFVEMT